jgi:membrane fusion protein, multidrug efflux system
VKRPGIGLRFRTMAVMGVVLAVVGGVAYRLSTPEEPVAKGGRSAGQGGRPVPVVTAVVERRDVPIYLDGLGTVQASQTVTVRSRVDGELVAVSFNEGQDVHAGDVLARIDPRTYKAQLDQAAASRDKDQAQLEAARRDLDRYVGLKDRVTGQLVDTQRALVKQLEATVRADQAVVDNTRTMLNYTTIVAPIDGRTGMRMVDQGNIVHAADATGLVVLTQVQPIAVIFTLPQQVLPRITGHVGRLPVVAMASDGRTPVDRGELELVDNQIDSTTGTIRIKALMPNANRQLWPGGFVNVRLLVDIAANGLVIPAPAVQRGPQGTYAFVVTPESTAEMRPIKVVQVDGDQALIAEGLAEGEKVVTDGGSKLQAGAKVADARPAPKDGAPKDGAPKDGGHRKHSTPSP